MMSTRPSTPKKERRTNRPFAIGSIRGRLLLASVATILLTAMVISAASVAISLRNGRREAIERLELVGELKGVEIDEWVRQVSSTLAQPLQQAPESSIVDTELSDVATTLLDNPPGTGLHSDAYETVAYNFGLWLQQADQFEAILFMDRDGQVLVSTDPSIEGQDLADDPRFQEGTLGSYLAPMSYSKSEGRSTTFTSRPVYGELGRLLGVVAGTVDASTLDRVMRLRERASLGQSGESYMVGADRSMLTDSRFAEAGTTVNTQGIAAAIETGQLEEGASRYDLAAAEMVGSGSYRNYANTQVIGVYRWIPDMQSALMVEQSRAEVFRAIYGAVILNGVVALVSALLAGAISLSIARSISDRLAGLVEAASEIAAGDLERTAQVGRRDEIGALAEAFNTMTARLRSLIGSLEQRVAARTRDLRRRARQMEAAAEVARDAAAIRDVDTLLNETVDLVSERFGFYHAGIFLVDDPREYAVLRAASSEGGQGMLERGHRLRVGQVGIVGHVAGFGEPRIALDVGEDAVFFDNPSLAETRSEMAVPLKIRGETIGVLDVQSTDEAAFDQEDVAVLQTMADQVAMAIENARLLQASQLALRELQMAQGEQVRRGWERGKRAPAFEYDRVDVRPSDLSSVDLVDRALNSGSVEAIEEPGNGRSALAAPLLLRDQAIGAITLEESAEGHAWTEDEKSLVKEVSDQVALALESARLFGEARLRAREQSVLSDLGRALTAQLGVEEILQEAYQRASDLIDTTDFFVGLYDPASDRIAVHLDTSGARGGQRGATGSANQVLSNYVVRTRRPALLPSNVQEWLSEHGTKSVGEPPESWLGVPLTVGEEVLGVMAVQSYSREQAYDEHDLDLLTTVGSQTAIALQSARLFEEALETAERLREVDRLKSQFLANMSHELRTPLNSIIGFSRVVLKGIDGPITDRQKEDLDAIHSSGQHLLGLINDILDVSKIEAGKMELDFETVDLREMIKGVMSTAVALVKDKPIELQRAISDTLPVITADERRVRQILLNLVSNAAKFTEAGFICVGADVKGGEVILSVADTGVGIDEKEKERIFEPFTQTDASTTREHGGTGLGLTISRSFVELHGGRIWVEGEPGEGSTFYVALPIEGPDSRTSDVGVPEIEDEAPPAEKTPEAESGELVLCVDDDTGVINLYRRYLNQRGYRVFGLTDSRRALDVAKRLQPYAITVDVMMPRKDGWEVIQELKADPATSDIPVVICSIISEAERGMSLGAADYLVKPIMEEDLVATLDRLGQTADSR